MRCGLLPRSAQSFRFRFPRTWVRRRVAEVPVRMALPAPRAEQISLLDRALAAFVVATMGGLILFAWQLTVPRLTQRCPASPAMTPAAAVGIIAAAVGLFCLTFRPIRPLARLIGFALIVLGLAVLSEDLFGFILGIDQALVRGDSVAAGAAQAGKLHMAPGITGLLILFGLALLYAKQGGISVGLQPDPGAHHPGPGADRARRLRLWRRHLLLSVPLHPDVDLWRAMPASCSRSACSPPLPNTASPPPSSSNRRPARCCVGSCPASSCCRW